MDFNSGDAGAAATGAGEKAEYEYRMEGRQGVNRWVNGLLLNLGFDQCHNRYKDRCRTVSRMQKRYLDRWMKAVERRKIWRWSLGRGNSLRYGGSADMVISNGLGTASIICLPLDRLLSTVYVPFT